MENRMIGIDITDLSDPLLQDRKNAHRLISNPKDIGKSNDFWAFWTSKEAVYKAQREMVRFAPKSIPIQFTDDHQFESNNLKGRLISTDGYILSLAYGSIPIGHLIFRRKTANPSAEIRQNVQKWFWDHYQVDTMVIPGDSDLPVLSHNLSPASISHHGRFLAFAWLAT